MSYRCESCQAISPAGARQQRVVVLSQEVKFPYRPAAHRFRRAGKQEVKDDPGGVGVQIVKELGVCAACRRLLEGDGAL